MKRRLLVLGAGTAGTMIVNKLRGGWTRASGTSPSSTGTTSTPTSRATCSCPFGTYTAEQLVALAARVPARRRRLRASARSTASTPRPTPCVLMDGRRPGLRLPGHRLRHVAAAGPDAGDARARSGAAASSTSTPSRAPRRWRGAARVRPRPAGRAHHRDADQVPGRAAGVHLPRRRLAAREGHARPGRAGLRDAAAGAFTKPIASGHLGAMLDERKIAVETDFMVERIDPERKALVSYDEREVPFDLLVTVPLNMGADFVARSGLGDELNYVPVDRHTLQSKAFANIFAVGDASRHPCLQGRLGGALLGRDLRRQLPAAHRRPADDRVVRRARQLLRRVRATARALLIDFNYDTEPLPGKYPLPLRRPDGPAQGDPGQPPRQARVPLDLLERAAARPADPAAGPHVDGRQDHAAPTT